MPALPYEFLTAPLVALLVVGLLALLLRWAFGSPRAGARRRDYGLLVPVLTASDPELADRVRQRLRANGIRGTLAPAGRGADSEGRPWPATATHVLVFPDDVDRARALVRTGRD